MCRVAEFGKKIPDEKLDHTDPVASDRHPPGHGRSIVKVEKKWGRGIPMAGVSKCFSSWLQRRLTPLRFFKPPDLIMVSFERRMIAKLSLIFVQILAQKQTIMDDLRDRDQT